MILQRNQTRSLLVALLLMLEDLETIDRDADNDIAWAIHPTCFQDVLYLEYYLYCRRMNERDKAGA